jgi:hypothetical protein
MTRSNKLTIRGDSNNAGEVVFEPAPGNRGTLVTVLQEFRMSKWTSLWETIVERSRTHLGLAKDSPIHRPIQSPAMGKVIAFPEVGERRVA